MYCPLDVQVMMKGYRLFAKGHPELAAKIAPLFITIDPARDTPAVVGQFAAHFGKELTGLTGDRRASRRGREGVCRLLQEGADAGSGGYLMDHSRAAYLMGPEGQTDRAVAGGQGRQGGGGGTCQVGALITENRFWDRPIEALTRDEWEALCDGCGKCCLHKLEDEGTGAVHRTNVACRLLDLKTGRCADYRHRKALVPDCLRLTPKLVREVAWLPATCAYRLRADGEPLPEWHYLDAGGPRSGEARRPFGGRQGDQRSAGRAAGRVVSCRMMTRMTRPPARCRRRGEGDPLPRFLTGEVRGSTPKSAAPGKTAPRTITVGDRELPLVVRRLCTGPGG